MNSVNAASPQPVLVIHGGAWDMPDDAIAAHKRGIAAALQAGWSALERGGTSVDAVEAAVTVMEDDDNFDAGRGSLRTGGVACVERLRNPIQAARLVLEKSPHVYFVGSGAERFATQHGMRLIDNTELIVPRERERLMAFQKAEAAGHADTTFSGEKAVAPQLDAETWDSTDPAQRQTALEAEVERSLPEEFRIVDPTLHSHDTVGAVALDSFGNVAAATSTGGTLSKAPGRVGDSSLIGCGCYADNQSAAVSLTGWGEPIMKLVLGKWAVDRVASGDSPQLAASAAIDHLFNRLGGHGGIILLGPDGRFGLAHNTPRMAWGLATAQGHQLGITRNN
jgi:beta-aspartyl-peptidase (threonine type)